MSDWSDTETLPMTIHTLGRFGIGGGVYRSSAGTGGQCSSYVISQNVAVYVPIWLPHRYPVQNFFAANGATINGNIDVGIYSQDGSKIWSAGPTVQAGANGLQFFAKDIILDPGCYYLAHASSSTTGTGFGNIFPSATRWRYMGLLQQSGLTSGTLPATATFAAFATTPHACPILGFTKMSGTPNF